MKNIFIFISVAIIVTAAIIVSCSKQDRTELIKIPVLPEVVFGDGANIGTFKLPDYTRIVPTTSGFEFHFPDSYRLAYMDNNDNLVITDEGGYKCTCEQGTGGCSPFYHPEFGFGCAQSTCTGSCRGRFVEKTILTNGVVINLNDPFRIIYKQEEAINTFRAKETLFEIDIVNEKIKEINLKFYGKEELTEADLNKTEYRKVGISLYGNLVAYALPVEFLDSKDGGPGDPTCECNPVMDDCKDAVKRKGIWFCKNKTCPDCTMTIGGVESGGD